MARNAEVETKDIHSIIAIGKAIAAHASEAKTVADIDFELYQWGEQLEDIRHAAMAEGSVRTGPSTHEEAPARA